jgi:hypothetical protein
MKKITPWILLFFTFLAACSPTTSPLPVPAQTSLAPPPITKIPGQEQPTIAAGQVDPQIPAYGFSGKLLVIQYHEEGNTLLELNLETGASRVLFQAPKNSWLAEAVASPDYQQLVLTYAAPTSGEEIQFGYTDLYQMPSDGSGAPVPFLTRPTEKDSYFYPTWGVDGQSIYLTHLYQVNPGEPVPSYQNDIEAATLDGQTHTVIPHGLWPALSPDGEQLAYLLSDPVNYTIELYVANPDGSSPYPVLENVLAPVDAHLFSHDGNYLIFSMVNLQPSPTRSWWEKLLGVQVASAHNVPSDWYRASVGGGTPLQMTNLNDLYLNGDLSPDGSKLAFISATGLYVMNPDGSDLVQLTKDVYVGGVSWVP